MSPALPLRTTPEVAEALAGRRPLVALETSIVAQGLPPPVNLEAALRCEEAVRARGAAPATVAVLDGELRIGLERGDLERLAAPGAAVRKLSSRDLGPALAAGLTGATTVAATVRSAALVGIRFMATGGIGGVHRSSGGPGAGQVSRGEEDVSADLFELARLPVAVFCSGPKMVLDVPATLERLESLCVPVLGYGCDECPAFYTAHSGCPVSARVDRPGEVASALAAGWAAGGAGAVVAIPPPRELLDAAAVVEKALAETVAAGQAVTPLLLSRVAEYSEGRSVAVNLELVANNAAVASDCAVAWAAVADGDAG